MWVCVRAGGRAGTNVPGPVVGNRGEGGGGGEGKDEEKEQKLKAEPSPERRGNMCHATCKSHTDELFKVREKKKHTSKQ